jgi:glycolate oxidase iron-sulfur subunit
MDSPRGRIYLMKALGEGAEQWTSTAVRHFDQCLGCMACVTACPSGVKYDRLIEETRFEAERQHQRTIGDRLLRWLLFALLPYPARLRILLLLQLVYAKSGLRRLVHALGVPRLWPRRVRAAEALIPPPSWTTVTARLPAVARAQGVRRARVALLAGCVQRVYFPQVNEAALRVLTAEGCDVVVPPSLGCCGALSVHAGREHQARSLARAALGALVPHDFDAIVVTAAGCGSSMKDWGRLLVDDPAWAERAAAVAGKVRDISEFLAALGTVAPRHPLPLKVAYHDACHLAHAQRIRAEPRALLSAVPRLLLVDLADSDQCCGSAGVYNLLEPESAREIGERKVESVVASAADLLVSANPGCTLQIEMLLRERGKAIATAHPVEVLDASIRGLPFRGQRGRS